MKNHPPHQSRITAKVDKTDKTDKTDKKNASQARLTGIPSYRVTTMLGAGRNC
ncbi:hypothetical protein [Vibrio mediterranei]|uniref:hypothetical protein n=1 Tax=Vibrio mediterranei TaxID=689 RepID=UPI00148BA5A9|nr:hypothetical protein [Vibrio mediterranei]